MPDIITAKIDVTKIDKARLFTGRNEAKYLDIVLLPVRESKYGETHMVVQSVSKEERDAGTRGNILGNATIRGGGNQGGAASSPPPRDVQKPIGGKATTENLDPDVPF